MSRQHRGRKRAPQIDHDEVQQIVLAYLYGRLSPDDDAAIEAHVDACAWCRADGLRHIATERHHLHTQRPKKPRRASRRVGMLALCGVFGALVGLAGFAGVMVMHPHRAPIAHDAQIPSPSPSMAATLTASPTMVPVLAPQSQVTGGAATALAWSRGGVLAVATAPDPATGTLGGVMAYTHSGHGWVGTRCPGFEGAAPPGTLAWSPDGTRLAGAGRAHLLLWNGGTCSQSAALTLPATPGTTLTIFDTATGAPVGNVSASLFAATGYLGWDAAGGLHAVAAGSTGGFALWDGPQGVRLWRDDTGQTLIGVTDADVAAHAALVRWSPDGRYLLWGYPRLPLSADGTATPLAAALTTALPAATALLRALQTAGTAPTMTLWLDLTGTQVAVALGGGPWTLRAAQTGAPYASLSAPPADAPARGGFVWGADATTCALASPAVSIYVVPPA